MGLFRFFKKPDRVEKNPLIAQAYNATAPASPPKRGKTPVRGNGPVSLQILQESLTHRADSSLASLSIDNEAPVPPPAIPRVRAGSIDRPTTAPHAHSQAQSQSGSSSRPASRSARRESFLGPPLSFRKPRAESYMPQQQKSFDRGCDRAMSIQSTGTNGSRHFVDILDAQSELKPTNFHSRIRASGVKDYGEDVADRNITVNGIDLATTLGQTFYAPAFDSAPSPVVARTTHHDEDLPLRRRRSQGKLSRSLSIKSQHAEETHSRASPKTIGRSMTLASYIPQSPTETRNQRRRRRSESMDITNTAKDAEFLNALAGQLQPSTSYNGNHIVSQENVSTFALAMVAHPPAKFREKSECRPKKERRGVNPLRSTIKAISRPGEHHPDPDEPESQHGGSNVASALNAPTFTKPASRSGVRFSVSGESDLDNLHSHGSHIEQQIQNRPETKGHITITKLAPFSGGEIGRRGSNTHETSDVPEDIEDGACPPPSIRTSVHQHSCGASRGSFSRTRTSWVISPATSEGMEEIIQEHIPGRNGEIRPWSISSTGTPPTTGSSATSIRPQSGHTANTSIDASRQQQEAACFGLPSDTLTPFNFAASLPESHSLAYGTTDMRSHGPPTVLSTFNVDDYVSSDEDSDDPMGPQRPRGKGEEALLFKDIGYGNMQLPGLFDSISQGDDTGTATPVPGNSSDETPPAEFQAEEENVETAYSTRTGEDSQSGDLEEQNTTYALPPLNLLRPGPPSAPEQAQRGSRAGGLRHASSAPAVRRHSAFGGSAYSSSDYAEDCSPRAARPSTSGYQRSSSRGSQSSIPPIPPRRRPVSMVIPTEPIPHVSEESDETSGSDSASDFEEEDRHFRAEFARHVEAERRSDSIPPQAGPAYIPPALQTHRGPVFRIPIPVKPPTPDTRKPTLPSHQTDEENMVLPVHQIRMPGVPRPHPGSVAHALESMRYSPASMHSSSSESLDDEGRRAPDMLRGRPRTANSPIPESPEESALPELPHGYAYGHGGAKYGNGYGFVRVLSDQSSKGSLPATPTEEREGFFGVRGKKLGRGSVSRSDSRASIHSERAREIVKRFKTKAGEE